MRSDAQTLDSVIHRENIIIILQISKLSPRETDTIALPTEQRFIQRTGYPPSEQTGPDRQYDNKGITLNDCRKPM